MLVQGLKGKGKNGMKFRNLFPTKLFSIENKYLLMQNH